MTKNRKHKWFIICGIILVIVLIYLPGILNYLYHDITGAPAAVDGSMVLGAEAQSGSKYYLDGSWEFYWEHLYISEPKQYSRPDFMIEVPGEWSKYKIDAKSLPAGGYGSYRLILSGEFSIKPVTLFIPDFGGAYKVFIDGQLTSESGRISKNTDEIFTVPKAELYPVQLSQTSTHEVIIEVATTRFSGLYMTPVLGDYGQIVRENSIRDAVRFILFGIALFAFIILMTMYLLMVRRKLYSFWMPLMIFLIMIRIMLTTEFYSFWQPILFFNLSYEAINEFMYLTTFALKYQLIFLIQEQCGISFRRREKLGFLTFYTILYLTYLLIPQDIYNHYLSVYIPMLTFTLDIYLFIKVYLSRQKLKKFGMVIFWGAGLVIMGLAIDSYYINGKIYMNMSLTMLLLFVAFLLIMNWVYAMRIGDLYDDFAVSSSRLEMAKNQIAMQKEYYYALSGQMKEIREIKHDINHFIGVMSRLAKEDKIDKLKDFLGEYCEKIEMDKLPVFCEHTIANSIIGYYYLRAKEFGISFESQCHIDTYTNMSDSDLCIVLGNALENAVYACRIMDPSQIRSISIESLTMKGERLITVKNTYNGQLDIREGRYLSLKDGNSHGNGISNIKKVVESYGGYLKIEHDAKTFTLMVAFSEK